MLRAVCFDLWNTLIADPRGQGEARAAGRVRRISEALRAGGRPLAAEAVTAALQATVDALVQIHQENRDVAAAERVALFYRHVDGGGQPQGNSPPSGWEGVRAALEDAVIHCPPQVLPGARETLAALRARGLPLALVSNSGLSPGASLRRLLQGWDLSSSFTAQVYSDEVGAWKPDARMFEAAVTALEVPAAEVLFVGDTAETDILGAQAFGIGLTALVGGPSADGVRPDFELASVQGLLPALLQRDLLEAPA